MQDAVLILHNIELTWILHFHFPLQTVPPDGAALSGVIAVLPRPGVAIAARMGLVGDSKN